MPKQQVEIFLRSKMLNENNLPILLTTSNQRQRRFLFGVMRSRAPKGSPREREEWHSKF
jgi:hypothetical protein